MSQSWSAVNDDEHSGESSSASHAFPDLPQQRQPPSGGGGGAVVGGVSGPGTIGETVSNVNAAKGMLSSSSSSSSSSSDAADAPTQVVVPKSEFQLGTVKFDIPPDFDFGTCDHPHKHLKKGEVKKSENGAKLKKVDLMLYTTTSPENPMIITTLLGLKGTIEFKKLKHFLLKMCYTHERMRMKVENSAWSKTDLDLDKMVRFHKVPSNLTSVEYISQKKILGGRIDTSDHLWEMHVLLTTKNEHVFLIRLHHVIGDGLALVKMVLHLFDSPQERASLANLAAANNNAGERTIAAAQEANASSEVEVVEVEEDDDESSAKEKKTKKTTTTTDGDVEKGVVRAPPPKPPPAAAAAGLGGAVVTRRRKKGGIAVVLGMVLKGIALMLVFPFVAMQIAFMQDDPPNTFRSKTREVDKLVGYTKAGLVTDYKFIGKVMGGTVNDIISALLAGALRKYQFKYGDPSQKVTDMTLVIPISTRSPKEKGVNLNNQVASVFLRVPVSEADLNTRYKITKQRMDALKNGPQLPVLVFLIMCVMHLLPQFLIRYSQEKFASKASMIFSNVPGPQHVQNIEGEPIASLFGFVPLVGDQQAGFACFSYAGTVHLSIICNPSTVKHPDDFCTFFLEEFEEYLKRCQDQDKKKAGMLGRRGTMVDTANISYGVSTTHQHAANDAVSSRRKISVLNVAALRRGSHVAPMPPVVGDAAGTEPPK